MKLIPAPVPDEFCKIMAYIASLHAFNLDLTNLSRVMTYCRVCLEPSDYERFYNYMNDYVLTEPSTEERSTWGKATGDWAANTLSMDEMIEIFSMMPNDMQQSAKHKEFYTRHDEYIN